VMVGANLIGLVSMGDLVHAKLMEMAQETNVLRDLTLSRP
jgi:hypothetical protein